MSLKVTIEPCPLGQGVFAKVPIEPMETIFYLTGKLISFEEAAAATLGENTIQVGVDQYIEPFSPARWLNHSCSPNSGFTDEIRLVAMRQIAPGEEIRFDYSTTMLERYWELDCSCGSSLCRGKIRDFDLLPSRLQRHYLQLGIVQPFILEELSTAKLLRREAA